MNGERQTRDASGLPSAIQASVSSAQLNGVKIRPAKPSKTYQRQNTRPNRPAIGHAKKNEMKDDSTNCKQRPADPQILHSLGHLCMFSEYHTRFSLQCIYASERPRERQALPTVIYLALVPPWILGLDPRLLSVLAKRCSIDPLLTLWTRPLALQPHPNAHVTMAMAAKVTV